MCARIYRKNLQATMESLLMDPPAPVQVPIEGEVFRNHKQFLIDACASYASDVLLPSVEPCAWEWRATRCTKPTRQSLSGVPYCTPHITSMRNRRWTAVARAYTRAVSDALYAHYRAQRSEVALRVAPALAGPPPLVPASPRLRGDAREAANAIAMRTAARERLNEAKRRWRTEKKEATKKLARVQQGDPE